MRAGPTSPPRAVSVLLVTDPRYPLSRVEQVIECADRGATKCGVRNTRPVTEIFRLRDGRWVY